MSKVVTRYGVEVDLSYEHKTACGRCRSRGLDHSGDNMHCYGLEKDGKHKGAHCFSCGFSIPSEEHMEKSGWGYEYDEEFDNMGLEFNKEVHNKLKENTGLDSKGYREIRTDISKWFGVRYEYSETDGSVVKMYYPCTKDYEISGYKVRNHPKDFRGALGEVGASTDLFGQFRFKTHSGIILIVGGEIDQLSAFQMLKDAQKDDRFDPVAVVCSTIGETSAFKQIQQQYEWLSGAKKLIVAMDNDEAGKKATEAIVDILPKGRVHVMNLRYKDPNEYLVNGKSNEFISDFWAAKPYTPGDVVGSSSLAEKIMESATLEKIPLPPFMHKVQDLMAGGIPLSKIVNLGSFSGAGKSTIADECVYFWAFHSPYKIGVVSLESDAGEYGTKLLSRHIGRKIDLIGDVSEKVEFLKSEYVQRKQEELFYKDGQDRFMLIDERDGGLESLKKQVDNLVIKCDCKVIILDPLQDILDGLSNEDQAVFMKWQKGLVKSHKVTFININHVRKSSGGSQANSTGASIHEEDFAGSSSIFKSAACNLLFTRNKEAECPIERNTTIMKMTKCRWTGRTDPHAGKYFYDNSTHTLYDYDDYMSKHPEMAKPSVDF